MVSKFIRETTDRVCAVVAEHRWIIIVKVGFAVDAARCEIVVPLDDRFWAAEIQAKPSITRRARCVANAFAIAENDGSKCFDEQLLILRLIFRELLRSRIVDQDQFKVLQLVATSPERERRVMVHSSNIVFGFLPHVLEEVLIDRIECISEFKLRPGKRRE